MNILDFVNENKQINLEKVKRTDYELVKMMKLHYSQPKGFVGRNICYLINFDSKVYGAICGGSATLFLPGRNEFFGIDGSTPFLNKIVNNIFYHIEPKGGKYPLRNFTFKVLNKFVERILIDWPLNYGDGVLGFETLVELPRTGDIYKRCGWIETGVTKGFTCKRIAGDGTDNWSGRRIWNMQDLKPKRVFCFKP